jgi:ABC-type antimicrobial peptide transport system permease subunit
MNNRDGVLGGTADAGDRIARLVLREGLALVVIGVALGVAEAFGVSRLGQSLLFASAQDPLSFIAASAALLVVAAIAGFLPARRASRVDPLLALRAG